MTFKVEYESSHFTLDGNCGLIEILVEVKCTPYEEVCEIQTIYWIDDNQYLSIGAFSNQEQVEIGALIEKEYLDQPTKDIDEDDIYDWKKGELNE